MNSTQPNPLAISSHTLVWNSEQDTAQTAQHLASSVSLLKNMLIELHGGLGAGKTTFVRYLLQALGIRGRIKSPSYAVVETYETPRFPIWHFDFYRFNDPQEWEDAGFRDIFSTQSLKLVEWPQQVGDLLPLADIKLTLTPDMLTKQRQVCIQTYSDKGEKLVQSWLDALPTPKTNP